MEIVYCGPLASIRRLLVAFEDEMDDRGLPNSVAGGVSLSDPMVLFSDALYIELPSVGAPHAMLLVDGRAEVIGMEGSWKPIEGCMAVLWGSQEPWSIRPLQTEIELFHIDSIGLEVRHITGRE